MDVCQILIAVVYFVCVSVHTGLCQTCQLDAIYSRVFGNAHFEFSVTDFTQNYEIKDKSDSIRVRVEYIPVLLVDTLNCNMTGNVETGNLSFVMIVQLTDYGTYKLTSGSQIQQCQVLYVLGKPTLPIIQSITNVISGHDVTLTCTSVSTTKPATHGLSMYYSWMVNDVTNPTDTRYAYSLSRKTLTVSAISKNDTGLTFVCTATENVNGGLSSNASERRIINILFGPEHVRLNSSKTVFAEELGNNFGPVRCLADCNPGCGYKWMKYTSTVSENAILYIDDLSQSKSGVYICFVSGTIGTVQIAITINVIYGPDTVILHPANDTYTVHESESLPNVRCTTACYPPCTFTWIKQGQAVSIDDILYFGKLSRSDAGTYTCTAANPLMSKTQTRNVQVNVIYGPDEAVLSNNSQLILTEGRKHVGIKCTSDCYPSCYASWSNLTSGIVAIGNDTLTLDPVTRHQSGSYKCTTRNPVVEYNRTADAILNVTVWYAPDVIIAMSNNWLIEHTDAELKCLASGVPNNYSYVALIQSWTGVTIPNSRGPVTNTPVNSSLNLIALRLQDTGTYTCDVSNGVVGLDGNIVQKSSVDIIINVSPQILSKQTMFTRPKSTSLTITIPFYSAESTNTVSFIRGDGIDIQNDNRTSVSYIKSPVKTKFYGVDVTLDGYLALLHIIDLQEADFMNYTITIQNSIGTNMQTISFFPKDYPPEQTPVNSGPIIGGVTGGVSIICITAVVTVFVLRRRQGKCIGNPQTRMDTDTVTKGVHVYYNTAESLNESVGNDITQTDGNTNAKRRQDSPWKSEEQYEKLNSANSTENMYLGINREQGGQQISEDRNVYVNLQLDNR